MDRRPLSLLTGIIVFGALAPGAGIGRNAAPGGSVPVDSSNGSVGYNRSRYEVIVERSPFGEELPMDEFRTQDPTVQQMMKELRLCFLLQGQSGEVRAGFENLKAKKGEPKSVLLMEGESYRAMTLVGIDIRNSTATLEYRGKNIRFDLKKSTVAAVASPDTPEILSPENLSPDEGYWRLLSPDELASQSAEQEQP